MSTVSGNGIRCVLCLLRVDYIDLPDGDVSKPCYCCIEMLEVLKDVIVHFELTPGIDNLKRFYYTNS